MWTPYVERKAKVAGPVVQLHETTFPELQRTIHDFLNDPTPERLATIEGYIACGEFVMARSALESRRIKRELEFQQQRLQRIKEEKEQLRKQAVLLQGRLHTAKEVRAQNEECRGLVNEINKLPTREEMSSCLEKFREDVLQPAEDRVKELRGMTQAYQTGVCALNEAIEQLERLSEDNGFTLNKLTQKRRSSHRAKKPKLEGDRKRRRESRASRHGD
uniref:Uncharacterized protein n=1 Tax=Steinernema glaseri TaxID=37863 RepID=A0A1I7YLK2_9BILA